MNLKYFGAGLILGSSFFIMVDLIGGLGKAVLLIDLPLLIIGIILFIKFNTK